ncbi:acetate/propionate family kinase [Microlunatus parietis]|uniref:Acetate kinase n=1 Tax=Microlunatus parietis TaxID=682979 RepID=A0A7Y9I826_9ACTN|nr:acetate kinase [Microlunatus parietis]NYE72033.1 acetate kinase [Microlunatus parietis]
MTTSAPVLVINAGSSSVKYRLIIPASAEVLADGTIERIGEHGGEVSHETGGETHSGDHTAEDIGAALELITEQFATYGPDLGQLDLLAVGHRVVHGGPDFARPTKITDDVLATIRDLSGLAPLHNPAAVAGIEAARQRFGDVPHVAVFDTAFFAELPEVARTYAIPRELAARHRIRRYGFHGTSHDYVAGVARESIKAAGPVRQITFHLGNGCSAAAILDGRPVETSMGLTPLQGLVMGTRSGDVDPGLHSYLHREAGLGPDDVDTLLNKESGLKGLAGVNDFREVLQRRADDDHDAALAFDVVVHRLKHYLGAYWAILGGLDQVIFTGGIGENSPDLRAAVADGLAGLGLAVDPDRNATAASEARLISADDSAVAVLVVPTDEELAIARQTAALAADD